MSEHLLRAEISPGPNIKDPPNEPAAGSRTLGVIQIRVLVLSYLDCQWTEVESLFVLSRPGSDGRWRLWTQKVEMFWRGWAEAVTKVGPQA